jgi:hypothetical protein
VHGRKTCLAGAEWLFVCNMTFDILSFYEVEITPKRLF